MFCLRNRIMRDTQFETFKKQHLSLSEVEKANRQREYMKKYTSKPGNIERKRFHAWWHVQKKRNLKWFDTYYEYITSPEPIKSSKPRSIYATYDTNNNNNVIALVDYDKEIIREIIQSHNKILQLLLKHNKSSV